MPQPLVCPQCQGQMEIKFDKLIRDKRAECPYCHIEVDLPDILEWRKEKRIEETTADGGKRIIYEQQTQRKFYSDSRIDQLINNVNSTEEFDQILANLIPPGTIPESMRQQLIKDFESSDMNINREKRSFEVTHHATTKIEKPTKQKAEGWLAALARLFGF